MDLDIKGTKIPGCYELLPMVRSDRRGSFVKTFHKDSFNKYHLITTFDEEYYSVSKQGVLRGMHFQTPPYDHTKIVYCVAGEVMDVVVDIRLGSPTYGQFEIFNLNSQKANIIYIPNGLAHGFYVISKSATLMYKVTTIYYSQNDTGILWNSLGIPWPDRSPLMSERDSEFLKFGELNSPFLYRGEEMDGY